MAFDEQTQPSCSLQSATFCLSESNESDDRSIDVRVSIRNSGFGMEIRMPGYSDCCSQDSEGVPIYLEEYSGEMYLRIFSDINSEEPTHNISLNNARDSNRVERVCINN